MGLGSHGVVLHDYGSTNFSYENSWFFRLLQTIQGQIHTFEKLEQVIFLEGKHFGRKSFGVDKNPVFGVANTYYFVMNNVVAITTCPTVLCTLG